LSLLTERLKKSSQLTKGIDTILNTFEERLSRLEDTILPVYNDTENLQKSQQSILDSRPPSLSLFFYLSLTCPTDIDRTLVLLDNVISYYNVPSEVESVIEKGPGEGGVDLEEYLHSLNRLSKAQKYFEKHIPQSVELENVVCT
jgi:exocyst complex protein 7